jgi:DNA-binding Xre family transcriptional regulator
MVKIPFEGNKTMKKLGISIRMQAARKDLSITQLAKNTELSRQTIHRLWRGKGVKAVDFSTIELLAKELDCSPLDFFYVTEELDE